MIISDKELNEEFFRLLDEFEDKGVEMFGILPNAKVRKECDTLEINDKDRRVANIRDALARSRDKAAEAEEWVPVADKKGRRLVDDVVKAIDKADEHMKEVGEGGSGR